METEKCSPESPPPIIVCLSKSLQILYKYVAGQYQMLSFGTLHENGVTNYPTTTDAIILLLIMLLNHVFHMFLLFFIPNFVSKKYPNLDSKLIPKLTANFINIIDKLIIVTAIFYVLAIDSECTVYGHFSLVTGVIKRHSKVSNFVHLSCISGYIYKLLFMTSYKLLEHLDTVHIIHHFISIYVYTVSFLFNQGGEMGLFVTLCQDFSDILMYTSRNLFRLRNELNMFKIYHILEPLLFYSSFASWFTFRIYFTTSYGIYAIATFADKYPCHILFWVVVVLFLILAMSFYVASAFLNVGYHRWHRPDPGQTKEKKL